jgi:uncharacterized protein (DUF305 family)
LIVVTRAARILLLVAAGAACRSGAARQPPLVQPGAPGQPSRVITPSAAADLSKVHFTGADVKFMQGMIAHHAQAVEMTHLLKTRTISEEMRKLALRIELSQADEITMMERWLRERGQDIPGGAMQHDHGDMLMPGMLSAVELGELAAATGVDFDRLFLQDMIRHHDGALVMVRELLAMPGAAQDSDIFSFVSEVDADQRMEMDRMGAMLRERTR